MPRRLPRILLNAATLLSLLAALALATLWLRSLGAYEELDRTSWDPARRRSTHTVIAWSAGRLSIYRERTDFAPGEDVMAAAFGSFSSHQRLPYEPSPTWDDWYSFRYAPPHPSLTSSGPSASLSTEWWLGARLFPAVAAAMILPAARAYQFVRRLRQRSREPGKCAHCGYDLRATPTRCPECGTATKHLAENAPFAQGHNP